MPTYTGKRHGDVIEVTVDDVPLQPRLDIRALSTDGYEWGYVGSGPYQLALDILAHQMGEKHALANYRSFCENTIARLKTDFWTLDGERIEQSLQGVVEVNMTLEELLNKVRGIS